MEFKIARIKEGKGEYYSTEKIGIHNYKIVICKLEQERRKIINILKRMEKEGIIKSIWRPANKKYKKEINELVNVKRQINETIKKIKTMFK